MYKRYALRILNGTDSIGRYIILVTQEYLPIIKRTVTGFT